MCKIIKLTDSHYDCSINHYQNLRKAKPKIDIVSYSCNYRIHADAMETHIRFLFLNEKAITIIPPIMLMS